MQPTLPAPLLASLSDMLAAHTGLHFPVGRWGDLERGISAAALDLGLPDAKSCAHRLLSAPITHREIEILASRLTVGETYFFREKRAFDALEQHILPALFQMRGRQDRRVRIWSAGCCTGEEPYSIAMLLDRMVPNAEAWNITILATDINLAFLRRAAQGEYGEWSFRDTPDWLRKRYFRHNKNRCYEIHEQIRRRVQFSYLNLADDIYPSLINNTNAMDVIFCRNVLMYFTTARSRIVVENLYHSLAEGGWLIVSPAETSTALFSRFTIVELDGAFLYRKDSSANRPHFVGQMPAQANDLLRESGRFAEDATPVLESLPEVMQATSLHASFSTEGTSIPLEKDRLSSMARECANQGMLNEAIEWCRQAIATDKLNPVHHYLLATIQQEQGEGEAAGQSLTRALYLNPDFVLAHFALGNLRRSQGRYREAQRHFDNALALLKTHSPEEILPESEGLTAGRLGEIIESTQACLPETATIP